MKKIITIVCLLFLMSCEIPKNENFDTNAKYGNGFVIGVNYNRSYDTCICDVMFYTIYEKEFRYPNKKTQIIKFVCGPGDYQIGDTLLLIKK